jgi:hypothetical protein
VVDVDFEEALSFELETIDSLSNSVFFLNADEGTKAPYIVCVSSEGLEDKCLEGYLKSKKIDCEINILHSSYRSMKDLTKLVKAKLLSFQGRAIGNGGPFIQNVTYEIPVEIYEKEVELYRSVIDLTVKI